MVGQIMTEAFRRYGATLQNPQWAVSAIASDGSVVISCWTHYFKRVGDALRYTDTLSRWSQNKPGNNLLRQHLEEIQAQDLDIRLVMARSNDTALVDSGSDASKATNTFSARMDVIGKLVTFDGDEFVIDFRKSEP